jgi:aminopeptidase N/puromycin-sensitive aminopeptidase
MFSRRAVLALGLVFVGCGSAWAQRLPGGVRPEHYALTITPDLAKARFAGVETIEVVLDAPATAITLNAAEIEFGAVRAYQWPSGLIFDPAPNKHWKDLPPPHYDLMQLDKNPETAAVTLDEAKQQATFAFAHPLAAGPVTLQITYTGILNDKLRGFYLSRTRLRSYGVTQFEATDARRAFPCFDEPALKATFDVGLVIDAGDTAISNMPVVSDTPGPVDGKHTLKFATTPKMSTYLLAWLVGDFQCSQGKSDGVPIRACATPDKVRLTPFALESAKWYLHYYDKYFGIKYPLKKLDMVAIPDFEAGAMENFGCITYRETEMLVDEKIGGLDAKKEVAETVAHEMSHQWFGDLVTPAWWDYLWLNEGFATWMETKAADAWQPKWEYPQDVALEKDRTMNEDASRTTRAIETRAETPAEIDELFDDIAYGKAGAVIAMVENWVGPDVFRKGVQAYLAAHLYGNATGQDFWAAQTQVSALPVDKVMRSFVEQPGVPLVTFEDRSQTGSYPATQAPFLLDGTSMEPKPNAGWVIPVCLKDGGCEVVPGGSTAMTPAKLNGPSFFYANANDKGYYRTAYAPAELKAIEANAATGLNVPERIGLLGDRWALVRGGQGTVGEFLDLVLALKQDANPTVMELALGKLDTIEEKIASADDRTRMDAVVRREFAPVYAAMSGTATGGAPKHEQPDHARLRAMLFEELGRAGDSAVMASAQLQTSQLFAGQKSADPMIADAAVVLATATGDAAIYDGLMKVLRVADDPDLKEAALNALTRFQAPPLVERTLEYAVSDAVRNQDSWGLIVQLLGRRATQDQSWEFIEQHWAEIERKSTPGSGARIVEAAGSFCSVEKRDQVASFFREHPVVESQRTLAKTLDGIDGCVALRASQEPQLRRWLDLQRVP